MAIGLPLGIHVVEARVALARVGGLDRVDLVEVLDDRLDRGPQAVEIEPVEAGLGRRMRLGVVAGPEPLHEGQDVAVPPHPGGEPPEPPQCCLGIRVVGRAHHVPVHPIGVGPVPFDRHHGEPQFVDEPASDARPLPIELVGAVRRLADQHDPPIPDETEERVVVLGHTCHRPRCPVEHLGRFVRQPTDRHHSTIHNPALLAPESEVHLAPVRPGRHAPSPAARPASRR